MGQTCHLQRRWCCLELLLRSVTGRSTPLSPDEISRLAAPGARSNDVDGMRDVAKPVVGGKLGDPPLDFRPLDFDGSSTLPAYQVVVMVLALAEAIARLAVVTAHHVDDAGLRQRSKLVVHGGESDILAAVP